MIRINLLSRRSVHPASALLVMSSALFVAAVILAGLYWVDQRYPLRGAWRELLSAHLPEEVSEPETPSPTDPVAATGPGESVAPAAGRGSAEPGGSAPTGPGALALGTAPAVPSRLPEQVEVLPIIAPGTVAGVRQLPRWSSACLRALALCRAIPAGVHFKSLTSNAAGEYAIEGLSTSPEAALEVFRDTLSEWSEVSLKWWRGGQVRARNAYKFTFQGKLDDLPLRELKPLPEAEAASLLRQITDWARQSGLDSLSVDVPPRVALGVGLAHQRQKIWARGSYGHITAFAEQLRGVAAVASLGELVMIPVYRGAERWRNARLYAVVDILVGPGGNLP